MTIKVFQGEREMASRQQAAGRVQPRRHPAGAARHAADRGDLRHRRQRHPARQARTRAPGKENKITIKANSGLSEAEIQQMVKDAELNAAEDKKKLELVQARNQAEATVHSVKQEPDRVRRQARGRREGEDRAAAIKDRKKP